MTIKKMRPRPHAKGECRFIRFDRARWFCVLHQMVTDISEYLNV